MRSGKVLRYVAAVGVAALIQVPPAGAQFAVIDVAAIVQEVQQVQRLAQLVQTAQHQLATAQDQLTQARAELQAMTGGRGMERLLAGVARNYLPRNWDDLSAVLAGGSGAYGALSNEVDTQVRANSVLPVAAVNALSVAERTLLTDDRRRAAMAQALSREALSAASDRFTSIQQLIGTIGTASDPKAILDLQARIQAEQGMVANETLKVRLLEQTLAAEESARRQRVREWAVQDVGSLRTLAPLGLLNGAP
jgi:type IV secretion system protein VirB5